MDITSYKNSLLSILVVFIVIESIAVWQADFLRRPEWSDESHFVAEVRAFGQGDMIARIADYKEVTPPLVYMVYGLWGRMVGFELQNLRILSLLLALVVYVVFHRLLYVAIGSGTVAAGTTLFLMINPYMLGTSIFVFTDMMTMACSVLFLWSVFCENPITAFVTAASALLSRQYSVCIVMAAGIVFLVRALRQHDRKSVMMTGACALSVLPLVLLMTLWKGLAPPSGLAYWNPDADNAFHLSYISTYFAMLTLYSFPVLIFAWRALYTDRRVLIGSIIGGVYYLAFPLSASQIALDQTDFVTVGLVHRLVKRMIPVPMLEHLLFLLCFIAGLVVIVQVVRHLRHVVTRTHATFTVFLDSAFLLFFVIMPFSYQVWEKYLLPLLPIVFLRVLMMKNDVPGPVSSANPDR